MNLELNRYLQQHGYERKEGVKEIHRLTGIPESTIYSHLNGTRRVGHWTAVRYYRGLGIPLESLLPEQEIEDL